MGGGNITKEEIVTALGYEPVGGQGVNLIKGTGTPTDIVAPSSNQYYFEDFEFTIGTLVPGETYTVSADVNILNGDIDSIRAIVTKEKESSYDNQGTFLTMLIENGRIVGQITVTGDRAVRLLIYAGIPGSTANNSIRISNLKLEPGIVTNPIWTPAPEDLVVRSELEIETEQIEGEYVNMAVEKYGHICTIHATTFGSYTTIQTKKPITVKKWVTLYISDKKPFYDIYFPVGLYPYNMYEANARITSNGIVALWAEKEIPAGTELHLNVTFICQ